MSTITTAEATLLAEAIKYNADVAATAAANAMMRGDEAWMLASTALVQIMTPGLAFFCAWAPPRGPTAAAPALTEAPRPPLPPFPPLQQTLASWARAARCPP